jgi:integrase
MRAESLEKEVKGQATPENGSQVQAAVYRLEALKDSIHVRQTKGQKTHTWLSKAEVKKLVDTCESDIRGQRDRLLLGLLVATGLRREEAANLRFEDMKLQPRDDRFRTVLAIKGKGAKNRTVLISDSLANAIDEWGKVVVVGSKGRILRSLGTGRKLGERMSTVAIFNVVRKRGEMIGKPESALHGLRRTHAQIGFEEGVPITQLSVLLGHTSVETTKRYLNLDLDLEVTASDFVPF